MKGAKKRRSPRRPIFEEDLASNHAMATRRGAVQQGARIMTYCNAGALGPRGAMHGAGRDQRSRS